MKLSFWLGSRGSSAIRSTWGKALFDMGHAGHSAVVFERSGYSHIMIQRNRLGSMAIFSYFPFGQTLKSAYKKGRGFPAGVESDLNLPQRAEVARARKRTRVLLRLSSS